MGILIRKYKRIGFLIASLPITFLFHSFITIELLDYIAFFPKIVYGIIIAVQLFIWYEACILMFLPLNRFDKFAICTIYYSLLIICMFARPTQIGGLIELNPFAILHNLNTTQEWVVVIFNICIFIPLITIHAFFISNFKWNVCICVCLVFIIEILQMLTRKGVFDIGDIILYFIGILIGFCVYLIFTKEKLKQSE